MNKEKEALKSFETIKEMYEYFVKKYRDLEPKLMICEKEDFDNVETALKTLEIIKEHIIVKSHADYTEFYLEFSLPKHGKGMTQNKEKIKLLKEVLK